jgi:hypothetical protein
MLRLGFDGANCAVCAAGHRSGKHRTKSRGRAQSNSTAVKIGRFQVCDCVQFPGEATLPTSGTTISTPPPPSARRARARSAAARRDERGQRERWYRPDLPDADWQEVKVPAPWEEWLGASYDGWGWYRAHVRLAAEARGRTVTLEIGRCDDSDWTYVNGMPVGSTAGSLKMRRYDIRPSDPAYAALNFGGDNVIAVEAFDGGGAGGLYIDTPTIGVVMDDLVWTPIDPRDGTAFAEPVRFGVVSWGPGDFFSSWETSRGAFGFEIAGHGVEFSGPLSSLGKLDIDVHEAFTDFAVSTPWIFQPLAYAETHRRLLVPDGGERYPCVARVVDRETGGEFVLIASSVAAMPAGPEALARLGIGGKTAR